MRAAMLSLTPADVHVGLPAGRRLVGMVMETGIEDAAYSLVAIADGTVSLYFSNGGGTIGAGQHETVRTAAAQFLDLAEQFVSRASTTSRTPLPGDGEVFFYFRTPDEVLRYAAEEIDRGEERDEFSPLFFAGHAVISEIREIQEARKR